MGIEKKYKKDILKGLSWSTLSKLSRQGIQLMFIFTMSRLLSPAEYGLMAMVMAFSMLAEIVRDMGTGSAIIQNNNANEEMYDTAFYFNITIGICVFLSFYFASPLIARFFHQPVLVAYIRVFSTIYLIGSLNIVQEAILQKNLEFKRLFYIDVISVVLSGILAVFFALKGYGTWSLIIQYITMTSIATIVLWITSSWKPSLRFNWDSFRQINSYSFNLFAHNVVYFFGRESDKFLIGKYLGPQALGIYHRAYMLMLMPINQINLIVSRVMFPVFSSMKGDIASMRKIYLKAISLIAFFTFPVLSIMFIVATPLITIILGKNWVEVAELLKIFIIYSMIESVGVTTAWIYKSLGHIKVMLWWGIFGAVVIIISALIGMQWGYKGIAIGYVVAQLTILWLPGWMIAFRYIDLKVTTVLRLLLPIFINSLIMSVAGYLVFSFAAPSLPAFFLIVLVVVVCVPLYALLSSLTRQPGVVIVGNFVKKTLRRRSA